MAKKYKMLRIPEDVWETWLKRKKKIEERIKIRTHKTKIVPLTKVLKYYGNRRVDIWDDELISFFAKNQKSRKFTGELI